MRNVYLSHPEPIRRPCTFNQWCAGPIDELYGLFNYNVTSLVISCRFPRPSCKYVLSILTRVSLKKTIYFSINGADNLIYSVHLGSVLSTRFTTKTFVMHLDINIFTNKQRRITFFVKLKRTMFIGSKLAHFSVWALM